MSVSLLTSNPARRMWRPGPRGPPRLTKYVERHRMAAPVPADGGRSSTARELIRAHAGRLVRCRRQADRAASHRAVGETIADAAGGGRHRRCRRRGRRRDPPERPGRRCDDAVAVPRRSVVDPLRRDARQATGAVDAADPEARPHAVHSRTAFSYQPGRRDACASTPGSGRCGGGRLGACRRFRRAANGLPRAADHGDDALSRCRREARSPPSRSTRQRLVSGEALDRLGSERRDAPRQ